MLSRISATLAQKARNLRSAEASEEIWENVALNLKSGAPFSPSDTVELKCSNGKGLHLSRLAMGTGSDGWLGNSNQTRKLGIKGLSDLLLHGFHEYGITCWDTADQYGSHPHVADALKQVRREDVVVLTKSVATTASQMRRDLDRFLKELGTDYIDILLLHCVTEADWPKRMEGVMDVVSEACGKGIVRMRGVSCHSFAALQTAAIEPWVEFDLARINPSMKSMDASPNDVIPVLQQMKDRGKSVMAMKVFGNGRLIKRKTDCLRFSLGLGCVDCMTIGFQGKDELDDIVRKIKDVSA